MLVKEVMTQNVRFIAPDATIKEAVDFMLQHGVGALPVLNSQQELVGIVTDSDFIPKRALVPRTGIFAAQILGEWSAGEALEDEYRHFSDKSVAEVMTRDVETIGPDESLSKAAQIMMKKNINRLPVVVDDRVVGILARHDLLKAF